MISRIGPLLICDVERTLTSLIQHGVLRYMDAKDRDVRLQASLATCTLFMRDPIAHHTSTASIATIDQVVGRLVRAALADPGAFNCPSFVISR